MPQRLWIDTETYSPVNLRTAGVYPYAEHPEAEVMIVSYALDDGPVEVWDVTAKPDEMPLELEDALLDEGVVLIAHNAQFDRVMLNHCLFPRFGLMIPITRWRCTMVRAYSCGLPGALGDLSKVMGIKESEKKLDGRTFINTFCIPNAKTGKRTLSHEAPDLWAQGLEYAGSDIYAMRAVAARMPLGCWAKAELATWHLDQVINDRGFQADLELVRGAIEETTHALAANRRAVDEATDGAVTAVTQRDKLLQHILSAYNVPLPDLRKSTLEKRLEDPDLPDEVKELLRLRLQGAKASVSKYKAVIAGVSADGRMRGALQYGGASRTLRWSGRRFQPHNLPRPTMKKAEIAAGIELLCRREAWLDYEVMELAANAVRGVLIAPDGRKVVTSDLANIEGRKAAWVAGEEWKVTAFRKFDRGEGPDLYKVSYGRAFGIDAADIGDDSTERQLGKVIELACQFQGAVGAFQSMAAVYGVTVPDERALELVKAWRKAHPRIVQFWYALEEAVFRARSGKVVELGPLVIKWQPEWMSIRLPSGRHLYYPKPNIEPDETITFGSVNRYTKVWERQHTYGGKLFENVVQASSRDVLALGMHRAEAEGYKPVLSVHDELVTETPDTDDFTVGGLVGLMTEGAEWTAGLPLAAKGFEARRYGK